MCLAVDKLVVNIEIAPPVAIPIGVNLVEHCPVQIQPSIAALIDDPHRYSGVCRCVGHLQSSSNSSSILCMTQNSLNDDWQ